MPNIFDQFDTPTPTIAPDAKNPFDAFDGNVFDQFDKPAPLKFANLPGNIKINPLQQVQMQSLSADKGIDPENSGATLVNLLRGNDDVFLSSVAPSITAAAHALADNPVTRGIGFGLNFAGQAIKGDVEAALFSMLGQKQLASQELIATAGNMNPAWKQRDENLGIDTSDPYEDARQTLPIAERMASGVGPGLLQTVPQLALGALQPELGAASFGFTPQGFDPVQATAALIAPGAGKMIGRIAEKLAAKVGLSNEQALNVINRLGGGTGVAGLISAPTAYQIAQMEPGKERDAAIQDAASNAIVTAVLGSISGHGESPEIDDKAHGSTALKDLTPNKTETSQRLDDLATRIKNLEASIRGNQPKPPAESPEPAPIGPSFRPSGESDLTPNQIQQSITEAINEKHTKITASADEDNTTQRHPDVVRRQAESAFSRIRQTEGPILANTAFDPGFYRTETGQRIQRIASQAAVPVVFYKGDPHSPRGFFNPKDGRLYLRTDTPEAEMTASLEHEFFHKRATAGDPAAHRVMAAINLNSQEAQKFAAKYNSWLLMHGRRPLAPDKLRQEIGAFHVSGQNYEGITLSDAFSNPVEALNAAREYHGARPTEQGPPSGGGLQYAPGKTSRSNVTRLGVKRKNPADWRATRDLWDRVGDGGILSDANRAAIARGRTPIVDDAWIRYFPEDVSLLGELIPMHHIAGSPITVPLAASRHLNGHTPGGFRYNPGGPGSVLPVHSAVAQKRRK